MTDPTKDIDGLLGYLSIAADRYSCHTIPSDVAANYRAALTALVAERDGLKRRVAELEAHPPADRDRELRERLVCAALTGLMAYSGQSSHRTFEAWADASVQQADATLAAMRKGEQP